MGLPISLASAIIKRLAAYSSGFVTVISLAHCANSRVRSYARCRAKGFESFDRHGPMLCKAKILFGVTSALASKISGSFLMTAQPLWR